jgi:hypothetical protein
MAYMRARSPMASFAWPDWLNRHETFCTPGYWRLEAVFFGAAVIGPVLTLAHTDGEIAASSFVSKRGHRINPDGPASRNITCQD